MSLATVTHARLRAGQGDVDVARRILREVLQEHPGHPEATALLEELREQSARGAVERGDEPAAAAPIPASAAELRQRFRAALGPGSRPSAAGAVVRLEDWLQRVRENRSREPR